MHVVIMGCGRVGSGLAQLLVSMGHTAAVIDKDPKSFRRIPTDLTGVDQHVGFGFDRDVLVAAGIERAGAFAAVSNGDNSNILAARVAREAFGVENVVARIYDPLRAAIYQRLGIQTVATVRWATDQIMRRMLLSAEPTVWTNETGELVVAEFNVLPEWVGRKAGELEDDETRVIGLTRFGSATMPRPDVLLQDGDVLQVATTRANLDLVRRRLENPPPSL